MLRICAASLLNLLVATAGDLSEKTHPRLLFPQSAEDQVRERFAKDPLAARLNAAAIANAEDVLQAPTCRYEIPDGKRLLAQSRLALHNILHCAWAWRMSGEEKFRLRVISELEAACALKDWNPSHFLDTAEMATAVAIGYDWLYSTLTADQRAMCEVAILEKALKPSKLLSEKAPWWAAPRNNWSQVCGAGIALASAAIAGKDQDMAEMCFDRGLKLVEQCSVFYEPDGMYPEGPGYWHYGTNFHVMMLAACEPLGRSFKRDPILKKGGDAILHLTSPSRLTFNFADSKAKRETPSAAQSWLASYFQDDLQAEIVRKHLATDLDEKKGRISGERWFPLTVLWLPSDPVLKKSLPNAAVFKGEQAVALFRSGWSENDAWFAIKGGTPAASHGHMDVGSFVYDIRGTRWLHDLGSDNYNLPFYSGKERWSYFRLQNRSHNTLEIDGKLQNPKSKPCPLTASEITGKTFSASFDLSDAYRNSAEKVTRSAHFDSLKGSVRIKDVITSPSGEVIWRAFTDAQVTISDERVILSKMNDKISLRLVSGKGKWSIADAKPPTSRENQNEDFRAIILTAPKAAVVELLVEIEP